MGASLVTTAARRGLYYGWVVVGTLATTETISWGILYYAFAAFLVPMQQELGWSTATLTGAYSLALLVSGLAAIPVGRWVDRHGPRIEPGSLPPCEATVAGEHAGVVTWRSAPVRGEPGRTAPGARSGRVRNG